MRDPLDTERMADNLLRYRFSAARDTMTTVGLAWSYGKTTAEMGLTLRALLKSSAAIARYLRQPMSWVESCSLDELNQWSEVTSELLKEERGGGGDAEHRDPFAVLQTDD